MAFTAEHARVAGQAFARLRAEDQAVERRLNLGDCFSYALAKKTDGAAPALQG